MYLPLLLGGLVFESMVKRVNGKDLTRRLWKQGNGPTMTAGFDLGRGMTPGVELGGIET